MDPVGVQLDHQPQGNKTILVVWRKLLIDSASLLLLQPCHSGRVVESELGHLEKEEWHKGGRSSPLFTSTVVFLHCLLLLISILYVNNGMSMHIGESIVTTQQGIITISPGLQAILAIFGIYILQIPLFKTMFWPNTRSSFMMTKFSSTIIYLHRMNTKQSKFTIN